MDQTSAEYNAHQLRSSQSALEIKLSKLTAQVNDLKTENAKLQSEASQVMLMMTSDGCWFFKVTYNTVGEIPQGHSQRQERRNTVEMNLNVVITYLIYD